MNKLQPALFVSHGTIFEALKSDYLRDGFRAIRQTQLPTPPDAIVVVSGHWLTRELTVTTAPRLFQMDEGFPPEFLVDYQPPGHPALAQQLSQLLTEAGIPVQADARRGLDHGALIPLRLLYPEADIPVVQLSLRYDLNPDFHRQVGEVLRPLRGRNVLFIGSGGLVHNRDQIERFTGHASIPADWAASFDAFVSQQLSEPATDSDTAHQLQRGVAIDGRDINRLLIPIVVGFSEQLQFVVFPGVLAVGLPASPGFGPDLSGNGCVAGRHRGGFYGSGGRLGHQAIG